MEMYQELLYRRSTKVCSEKLKTTIAKKKQKTNMLKMPQKCLSHIKGFVHQIPVPLFFHTP